MNISPLRWFLLFTGRVMAYALLLVGVMWSVLLWAGGADPWWSAGLSQIAVACAADWWLVTRAGGSWKELSK